MSKKPVVHYMATLPDGTVLATDGAHVGERTSVNLAAHVGEVIDHPTPGRRWYDESPFSYFRSYTRPGEVLERVPQWPARLWVVEPLGETGNWGGVHYPYWVLSHQLRVVEETEIWRAFGSRGDKVLRLIAQMPDLAREWVAEWSADPEATRERYRQWRRTVIGSPYPSNHITAKSWSSRREAALDKATELADAVVREAWGETAVSDEDLVLLQTRAYGLVAAEMFQDRLSDHDFQRDLLKVLRGKPNTSDLTGEHRPALVLA
ncbi:hypothetical protein ABR738_01275 [Streptomyces sp. Edi4]|uniref:hypothetical protein n=1 Tax=Streptomyces sp. Edi4 TaxID=3162527 RepID=UPI003305963D